MKKKMDTEMEATSTGFYRNYLFPQIDIRDSIGAICFPTEGDTNVDPQVL